MAEERRDSAASRKSGNGKRRSSMKKRSSAMFNKARLSFYRTGGNRGASVETLRGTSGADFEGKAKVLRGQTPGLWCMCFRGGGDGENKKERHILIKGHFLFVFADENAPSPQYAIDLIHRKTEILEASHRPSQHGSTTVLLETPLGDVDYKIIFDTTQDAETPQKFARVVAEQSAAAEAELAKERLGHELHRNKSVKYAEDIGAKKTQAQPDAPLTAEELIDASPLHVDAY